MTYPSPHHSVARLKLAGLVAMILLFGLSFIGQGSQTATPADAPVTVEIMTNATDVQAGEYFDVFVRMIFSGDSVPPPEYGRLNFNIGMPPTVVDKGSMRARVIDGQSEGIQTVTLRMEGNRLQWQGLMQEGGRVTIGVRIKTPICFDAAGLQQTLQAEGQLADSTEKAVASKSVQINCLSALSGDDITLVKSIVRLDSDGGIVEESVSELVGVRERVGLKIDVTNHTEEPIVALITNDMVAEDEEDEDQCFNRISRTTASGGRNISILDQSHGGTELIDADGSQLGLDIAPGETRTYMFLGYVYSGIIDCILSGAADARGIPAAAVRRVDESWLGMSNAPAANIKPGLSLLRTLQQIPPISSNAVTLTVVAPDLGDAPDSSNHFGAGMSAYPGVPADFPSVFDPATGVPPGPRHRVAPPLHLGSQVSRETESDLTPNRNLDPPANLANLDRADDGVNLAALTLADCQPTPVEAIVQVDPRAVAHFQSSGTKAYLNVWIDGNRDGDWDDSTNCGQEVGLGLEHIVIDQPVDVTALGAGVHTISANSLPILWPTEKANRPAWLRATLSDQPAPKGLNAGNIHHGDGRGPAAGYLLGETEDYLLVGVDTANEFLYGPDMMVETDVTVEGTWEESDLHSLERLGAQQITYQVRFRNRGDLPSLATRVQIFSTPYLGVPAAVEDKHDWVWCLTCTLASGIQGMSVAPATAVLPMHEVCDEPGDCHLEIDMMEVPEGKGGQKILRWRWMPEIGDEVVITTRVVAAEDANQVYNETEQVIQRPLRPIRILYPGNATINKNIFTARGLAEPGKILHIFADGYESGAITANENGRWSVEITLPEGAHRLWGAYVDPAAQTFATGLAPSSDMHIEYCVLGIDLSLGWEPASLMIQRLRETDALSAQNSCIGAAGSQIRPIDLMGRTDAEGWRLPVSAKALCDNETYEISVEVSCEPDPTVTLVWDDTPIVHLTDPDGDSVFTGRFKGTDEELQAALEVTCGTDQTAYIGETEKNLGVLTVVDASTGLPIEGASVLLMITADMEIWELWPDDILGPANPQVTDSWGRSIWQMPGSYSYRMIITHPDYQLFRSPVFRGSGMLPSRTIGLTPLDGALENAGYQVDITEAGFDTSEKHIRRGDAVRIRNMDMAEHRLKGLVLAKLPQAQAVSAAFDTGVLAAGESVGLLFAENGIYHFGDSEDPMNQITIIVEDMIFFPMIQR